MFEFHKKNFEFKPLSIINEKDNIHDNNETLSTLFMGSEFIFQNIVQIINFNFSYCSVLYMMTKRK